MVLDGITGKIRFTKDRYRNITDLEAKEVTDGNIEEVRKELHCVEYVDHSSYMFV